MMGKSNYYKSYNKNNKKSWSKDFKRAFRDITDSIIKNISCRTNCAPVACGSNGARWCIYALIVLTLLFSGIGFYSWVIIGMLCLVLQFV
ncbi:MAG: hypothetical protein RSD13_03040 [Clostridium sp.]